MKDRVLSVLNIKVSESANVFDLLRVQLFIGLGISYINILAYTLFLKTLSIHLLPYAFITIAVLLFLLNIGYEKLEHRTSPLMLLKYIIFFSVFVLIVIWAGLVWSNKHIFIFLLLVWSTLFYMLNGYTYWGMVSLLFNVRESKRVFSIVGAGDIPAKLIGYLSVPLLLPMVGLTHMIWLSVLSLLIALFFFNQAIKRGNWESIKHTHDHTSHHVVNETQKKGLVDVIFKNELIFSISIISILSYNVFNLIDYTFLSHVKMRYEDLASLAAFVAAFFAVGRIIALALKLIITSRVIERWGIIVCLFITPVILFLFSLVFFAIDNKSDLSLYIFGMMVLITEVLRSTMQEPVFFILFQPLKEKLRLAGHLISKGHMLPLSFVVVGVSLIILNNFGIDVTVLLTVKIVLINLVAWAVAILYVKRAYLKTLHQSIQKGVFNSEDVYLYDKESVDILLNKIKNGTQSEIIYALKLLGKAKHPDFESLLYEQLMSGDKEVKMYALAELMHNKAANLDLLKQLAEKETDIDVKQSMIAIICRYDRDYLNSLAERISFLEYPIQKVIIINLLNQEEFNDLFKAGNALNNLIQSPLPKERDLAISIISELKNVRFTNAIEQLINDEDSAVKRNAIVAACKLHVQNILPGILDMLDDPSQKYIALQGLLQYGDNLFNDVIADSNENHTSELIRLAGKMKGPHSTEYLLACINQTPDLIDKIVYSLWRKEFKPVDIKETKLINHLLDQCFLSAKKKLDYYRSMVNEHNHVLVKNSLHGEIQNDLETGLRICCFLYDKHELNRILELIEMGDRTKLYNAMEMLEMVLPQRITKELNMLFDHITDPADTRKLYKPTEVKSLFDTIVFTSANEFTPWTKAVCIYSSWQNKEYAFIRKLNGSINDKQHYVMRETTSYVLNALT